MKHGNQCVTLGDFNRMELLNQVVEEMVYAARADAWYKFYPLPEGFDRDRFWPKMGKPVWVKQQEREG